MSPAEARYVQAITRERASRGRVTVNALARALELKPASVSQMLGRLAADGIVAREASGAVTLTPAGERAAGAMAERRAVVERFLRVVLEVPEADLPAEADRVAQSISERLEERMRVSLAARAGAPSAPPARP